MCCTYCAKKVDGASYNCCILSDRQSNHSKRHVKIKNLMNRLNGSLPSARVNSACQCGIRLCKWDGRVTSRSDGSSRIEWGQTSSKCFLGLFFLPQLVGAPLWATLRWPFDSIWQHLSDSCRLWYRRRSPLVTPGDQELVVWFDSFHCYYWPDKGPTNNQKGRSFGPTITFLVSCSVGVKRTVSCIAFRLVSSWWLLLDSCPFCGGARSAVCKSAQDSRQRGQMIRRGRINTRDRFASQTWNERPLTGRILSLSTSSMDTVACRWNRKEAWSGHRRHDYRLHWRQVAFFKQ